MRTWDKLTQNFPKGLYYLKPIYLYKKSDGSHYIYVEYPLSYGKFINIVLNVKLQDNFSWYYIQNFRRSINNYTCLSNVKRYYDLVSYRYVNSYRKDWV